MDYEVHVVKIGRLGRLAPLKREGLVGEGGGKGKG